MFNRGYQPKQVSIPPMPKTKKYGSTAINVITALDGCADKCRKFDIKIESQLSTKDPLKPTIYIYKCVHADQCYQLAETLKITNADDEEE